MDRRDGDDAQRPLTERGKPASLRPSGQKELSSVLPEMLACVSASSFHISLGLMLGYSAILLPQIEADNSDIKVNPTTESPWIASGISFATMVGSLFTGIIMNFFGRIRTIRIAIIPYCMGWCIIATATGVPAIIVGRLLTGFGAGTMGSNPAVVYTTEVAQPKWRGALASTAPCMVSLGTMIVYTLGTYLPWRTVAWICFCSPVIPLVTTLLWSPESPLWLANKGRKLALEKSLKILARKTPNFDPVQRANQMLEEAETRKTIRRNALKNQHFCVHIFQIAGQKTVFRPLLLLVFLFFVMHFSGIYVILFYTVSVFQDVGSALDPHYSTVCIGVLRVIFSVLAIVLLRIFPRRSLMLFSSVGASFSMGFAGYFAHISDGGKVPLSALEGSFATASVLLFMTFAMVGLLTIPWTMTAELFPAEARSYCQGIAVTISSTLMFSSVQLFRPFINSFGHVAYVMWMYSGVAAFAIVIVVFFLPETHGRALAQIEEYFRTSWIYLGYERRLRRYAEEPAVENGQGYKAVSQEPVKS